MRELNDYFDTKIEVPLVRYGKRQRIETFINEEALLLANTLDLRYQTGALECNVRVKFVNMKNDREKSKEIGGTQERKLVS